MGEPAAAHPIRAFVGVNSEPIYPSGRSEMMLDELERLGRLRAVPSAARESHRDGVGRSDDDRGGRVLHQGRHRDRVHPVRARSLFLEVQKVHLGRSQFRGLLWGVKQRLAGIPEAERPKVLVFGESLGSWSSSDVVMHQGSLRVRSLRNRQGSLVRVGGAGEMVEDRHAPRFERTRAAGNGGGVRQLRAVRGS